MLMWLEFWISFMGSNYDPIWKARIATWMKYFGRSVVVAEGMPPAVRTSINIVFSANLGSFVREVWEIKLRLGFGEFLSDCISLFIIVKFFSRVLSVDVGFSAEPRKSCVYFFFSSLFCVIVRIRVCPIFVIVNYNKYYTNIT